MICAYCDCRIVILMAPYWIWIRVYNWIAGDVPFHNVNRAFGQKHQHNIIQGHCCPKSSGKANTVSYSSRLPSKAFPECTSCVATIVPQSSPGSARIARESLEASMANPGSGTDTSFMLLSFQQPMFVSSDISKCRSSK